MSGFLEFCKTNRSLIVFTAFFAFLAFSAKLFLFTVGIDTEVFIADRSGIHNVFIEANRFTVVLLQNLWQFYNPLHATILSFVFLASGVVSWAYFISYFDPKKGKRLPIFAFAAVAVSSPIWAEWLQFALMSAELFFGFFITPFAIILLFNGFKKDNKKKIVAAIILMSLLISAYQAFATLLVFGFAAAFLFLSQESDFDKKLPIKIFLAFLLALGIYAVVGKSVILLSGIERGEYLSNMQRWNFGSIKSNIINIFGFAYILTFAKIAPLHEIISTAFLDTAQYTASTGVAVSCRIFELSTVFGSVLLFPLVIIFLIYAFTQKGKMQNKFIYISSVILVPFSVLLFAIALGGNPPFRTLITLPLAFGFVFYFLISRSRKRLVVRCFAVAAFALALHLSQISSTLFYSDSERFRQDVFLAQQIDLKIQKIDSENQGESRPIAFIGRRQLPKSPIFLRGEAIGFSHFEFFADPFLESSLYGVYFMQSLGMNYAHPDGNQMNLARIISREMPIFPKEGSVIDLGDFIVVKLSESAFVE